MKHQKTTETKKYLQTHIEVSALQTQMMIHIKKNDVVINLNLIYIKTQHKYMDYLEELKGKFQ